MKNVPALLVLILFFICWTCTPNNRSENNSSDSDAEETQKDTIQIDQTSSFELNESHLDFIIHYNDKVIESEKTIIETVLLDAVILHDYFSEEYGNVPDSSYGEIVEVYRLQDESFLIVVEYNSLFGSFGPIAQVVVVDSKSLIVHFDEKIGGSKYAPPEITWLDVDNDGQKEIFSLLTLPTSSVSVIDYLHTVYELNREPFQLVEAFRLSVESIDCSGLTIKETGFAIETGVLVERKYEFENPNEIRINEMTYQFNCDDYRKPKATSKQLLKTKASIWKRTDNWDIFLEK